MSFVCICTLLSWTCSRMWMQNTTKLPLYTPRTPRGKGCHGKGFGENDLRSSLYRSTKRLDLFDLLWCRCPRCGCIRDTKATRNGGDFCENSPESTISGKHTISMDRGHFHLTGEVRWGFEVREDYERLHQWLRVTSKMSGNDYNICICYLKCIYVF